MIKKISTFLLLLSVFSFAIWFEIPSPNWVINDLTNTLTIDQKSQLSDLISNIKQTTSVEIAVLIVPTIDWDDVNLLATDIWNKRWVWQKWKDNWIIMLFAMEDRSRSIQVWYWLEWTIPDAIAKRIWENNIVPNFREWNYFQGIYSSINDINLYIQKDPTVIQAYSENSNSSNSTSFDWNGLATWLIWVFFIASAAIGKSIIPKSKRKDKKKRLKAILIIWWIWVLLWLISWSIIRSIIAWYIWMLFWIFWKWWNWWVGFGGWWFSSWWWFSSGWSSFWWWSFGGGGGGGKR